MYVYICIRKYICMYHNIIIDFTIIDVTVMPTYVCLHVIMFYYVRIYISYVRIYIYIYIYRCRCDKVKHGNIS